MGSTVLHTERLLVRELPPRACSAVARFLHENAHFHRQWEPTRSTSYFEPATHRRMLRSSRATDQQLHLWLFARDGGRRAWTRWNGRAVIGSITLSAIVLGSFRNCVLGYKMDARFTRRGLMSEALHAVLDYAFDSLELHRVELSVMPANEASIGLASRLGFTQEGISRRFLKIQGVWEDHLRMSLLADEWATRRARSTRG